MSTNENMLYFNLDSFKKGLYIVPVTVTCKGSFANLSTNFVVDTGCSRTCIDIETVSMYTSNIKKEGRYRVSTGNGEKEEDLTTLDKILIGGKLIWDEPMVGLDTASFRKDLLARESYRPEEAPPHVCGLLGMDFLGNFDFTITTTGTLILVSTDGQRRNPKRKFRKTNLMQDDLGKFTKSKENKSKGILEFGQQY